LQWMSPEFIALRLPILNTYQFVGLCNGLLTAVARTAGIDVSHLRTNLPVLDPDGGLDASCVDAPLTVGRIIPASTVGYQFKGGRTVRSPRDVARDDVFQKPRVVELLKAGHPFVYLAATDYGDRFESDVATQVRKLGIAVVDGQIIVIGGYALAQQLQAYPSRIAQVFGLDERLSAFEEWAGREHEQSISG
jgi:hypothetical protein